MRFALIAVLVAIVGLAWNDSTLRTQQAAAGNAPQTRTICIKEPKQNTRKVYACKVEQYCLPRCDLLSLLRGECGCNVGSCSGVMLRHRLVVKKVKGSDTTQCVPREAPSACHSPNVPVSASPAAAAPKPALPSVAPQANP